MIIREKLGELLRFQKITFSRRLYLAGSHKQTHIGEGGGGGEIMGRHI